MAKRFAKRCDRARKEPAWGRQGLRPTIGLKSKICLAFEERLSLSRLFVPQGGFAFSGISRVARDELVIRPFISWFRVEFTNSNTSPPFDNSILTLPTRCQEEKNSLSLAMQSSDESDFFEAISTVRRHSHRFRLGNFRRPPGMKTQCIQRGKFFQKTFQKRDDEDHFSHRLFKIPNGLVPNPWILRDTLIIRGSDGAAG